MKKPRFKKHDMKCRAPGCKARSMGPRFRFRCEKHQLPGIGYGKVTHGKITVRRAKAA